MLGPLPKHFNPILVEVTGTRTGDPLLAKQVLSQLSYTPVRSELFRWWAQVDSNHRPHDYQSCALAS